MKRQQSLQHRLHTLSALQEAVGAMRSLSAHHFRRARQSLPAARSYRNEMNTIIAEIGIQQTVHAGVPAGLLVIASDLGLCADYNSRISRLATVEATTRATGTLYSVGRRARNILAKQSLIPSRTYDAPASAEGLLQLLLRLAQDVLNDYLAAKIGSLQVVSARFEGVGHFQALSQCVLPIQSLSAAQPLRRSSYVDDDHLAAVAVREYLYMTLYEVLLDALAAEHGMRLMAAESALEWIDATVAATSRHLASVRSEAATQELLDIVAGGRKRVHVDT